MFRFLADENFNADFVRGLLLQDPRVDLLRVQEVGLIAVDDPRILSWAADRNRIVLTHDRATVPEFAFARITPRTHGRLVCPFRPVPRRSGHPRTVADRRMQ